VETILSGPAASIMGAMALESSPAAPFSCWTWRDDDGHRSHAGRAAPPRHPRRFHRRHEDTGPRLKVTSVGVGGDSRIQVGADRVCRVGPIRDGTPPAWAAQAPPPWTRLFCWVPAGGTHRGRAWPSSPWPQAPP
jgi:hypothetical protein